MTGTALVPAALGGEATAWRSLTQGARDDHLSLAGLELIRRGIPDTTWKAYRHQWLKFVAWCKATGRTAVPVRENTMISFLAYMASLDPRPAPPTMWIWYSAVRFVHGMGDPPVPWECGRRLAEAMGGYTREMIEAGWRPKRAPRAFPDQVQRMVDQCDRSTVAGIRDASVLLTGFLTAARVSHMTIYRLHDVARARNGLELYLPFSKNDQAGKGETIALANNDEHPAYCPARTTLAWVDALAEQGIREGALYRPVDKYGNITPAGGGRAYRMSTMSLTGVVKKYAQAAGLGSDYTMHSMRRGMATWLRELGLDPITIAETFGWAPSSRAFLVYMEEAKRWQADSPAMLAKL